MKILNEKFTYSEVFTFAVGAGTDGVVVEVGAGAGSATGGLVSRR